MRQAATAWARTPSDRLPQIDGRPTHCRSARLTSRFGTWSYGLHPHGHDSWWFAEEAGGGTITLPFVIHDGEILVGLIEEDRPNLGGSALCAIGGYVDPGESHHDAEAREVSEEAGVVTGQSRALPGLPVIPNRAFFAADVARGEGVHLFAVRVDRADLTPGAPRSVFRWITPAGAEAREVVFLPWREAVSASPDALALAAIARLVAWIEGGMHELPSPTT